MKCVLGIGIDLFRKHPCSFYTGHRWMAVEVIVTTELASVASCKYETARSIQLGTQLSQGDKSD